MKAGAVEETKNELANGVVVRQWLFSDGSLMVCFDGEHSDVIQTSDSFLDWYMKIPSVRELVGRFRLTAVKYTGAVSLHFRKDGY